VLVTGDNGVGKTNLLEAVHVGTQGFSPRTRADAQIVRDGASTGRIALEGARGPVATQLEVTLGVSSPKRATMNGAALRSPELLREEIATLVFTPDRLAVVKGGPATRRAYLDRALARMLPARASLPTEYGSALGQRNAALRRMGAGLSDTGALSPWTEAVARLGAALVEARRAAIAILAPSFAERAGELGLDDARLRYDGEAPTVAALETRIARDVERGATGIGPHLHDIAVCSGVRDLRPFGSQGEQRLAVLALLLAEAEVLTERRSVPPLVLLDDVLSELDGSRRRVLGERLGRHGQTIVTATGADALPLAPSQLLAVVPGRVTEVV
jgi:DNA replication and repair protein RecF